jgi:hypothetical protein
MKTLLAALIALGTLAGTANAQHVRFIGHGYGHGPAYCAPGTVHVQRQVSVAPVAVAPVQQAEAPAEAAPEAPAEAAPEAPADNAAPLQAPLPPK